MESEEAFLARIFRVLLDTQATENWFDILWRMGGDASLVLRGSIELKYEDAKRLEEILEKL